MAKTEQTTGLILQPAFLNSLNGFDGLGHHTGAAVDGKFPKIDLTAEVSGLLPVANQVMDYEEIDISGVNTTQFTTSVTLTGRLRKYTFIATKKQLVVCYINTFSGASNTTDLSFSDILPAGWYPTSSRVYIPMYVLDGSGANLSDIAAGGLFINDRTFVFSVDKSSGTTPNITTRPSFSGFGNGGIGFLKGINSTVFTYII